METFNDLFDILDKITIVFAFLTMLMVFNGLLKSRQQRQKIIISFLVDGEKEVFLPNINMIRQHATRSEIGGLLGIFQKDSKNRYNIQYLSSKEFFERLYEVQKGKSDKIAIYVTKDEAQQFDIDLEGQHQ